MKVFLFASLLFATWAQAELPVIRLDTVLPLGGRQGTEVEVAITGADLDEAKTLVFSHPSLSGTVKADKKFAVKIAPDVPPGRYELRVSGLFGLSNPRSFTVSDHPEAASEKPPTKRDAAFPLERGTIYNGAATAAAADYFTFQAEAGERLLVLCEAARIDSKLTPELKVIGPSGKELVAAMRGGLLDFTATEKGPHLLVLHDLTYAGGPEYGYRLTVSTSPWIDFILPPAAPPGSKADLTLYGRNLPGGQPTEVKAADGHLLEKLTVSCEIPALGTAAAPDAEAPAAAALDGFSYRLQTSQGNSNPVFVEFSRTPLLIEQEPNDHPEQAQAITPPCEIAGQFQAPADVDCYCFAAKKGDVYWIELTSSRLGQPTNSFLLLQRESADLQEVYASDSNAGTLRFSTVSNDPAFRFEAKEDGQYRLQVRDLFGGTRRDPANIYHFAIRPAAPDFSLVAVTEPLMEKKDDRTAAPFAPVLRPGGTSAIRVIALRRDDFAGEIELSVEGLPSGVTCLPSHIVAGKGDGLLLLTAGEKSEPWSGAIRVLGKAKIGETELVHPARGGAVQWPSKDYNTEPVHARLMQDIGLAVSGPDLSPLAIAPAEEKIWEAPVGGKLEIPFQVTRRGEFKEALKLKPAGFAALDPAPEIDVAAGANEAKVSLDLAALKLPAGAYSLYLQAFTKGKFRGKDATMSLYSTPARILVKAP